MSTPPIWSPIELKQYIVKNNIPAEIFHLRTETPTVPAAAEALGVPVDVIVKTVIFMIDGKAYAVLANGTRRVDFKKLAARYGVTRKKVKLADAHEVIALTGYMPGTVPPFGHREPIACLIDPAVLQQEIVYAGGGGESALMRIRSADLQRLTGAEVLSVLQDDAGYESQ